MAEEGTTVEPVAAAATVASDCPTAGEADVPPPPPPPPEAAGGSGGGAGNGTAAGSRHAAAEGPRIVLEARVLHKRTYGNKLVFLDVARSQQQEPPQQSVATGAGEEEEEEEEPPGAKADEVVFSFEVYGAEVRKIRKDISVGDLVRFEGVFRPGGHILDAIAYAILERWTEVSNGRGFNAFADGGADYQRHRGDGGGGGGEARPKADAVRTVCKFWVSNGTCRRAGCECEHPEGDELRDARGQYWEAQKKRKAESANPEDPHRLEDKRSHAARAAVFADWLCTVYGLEALRLDGVVDVAGGRGELAFELSVKRGIPCTVVDPRCPGPGAEAGSPSDEEVASPWVGWRLSRPQRLWLESNVPGLRGFAGCQAHVESSPLRQCRSLVPSESSAGSTSTELLLARWLRIVGSCRVIVGLHPDQATGGVVELARAFSKPFAVVPCCTFADDFPDRRLAEGRLVRTYDDLVSWLRERQGNTEVTYLGFQGKNLVVFAPTAQAKPAAEPAAAPAQTDEA